MTVQDKLKTEKAREIIRGGNLTYVGMFGSFAKGLQNKKSDVDILFNYNKDKKFSLFDMVDIQEQFEELLGRKVDFVPINGIKKEIKEEVLNSVIDIYGQR
ncbi:MAG: hypothetical protein US52_C0010G0007 [candidate division WS6 bacterium GW2011_GWA2_37_6]|uniref:Polymerase nucleotidyl transferase domain-containing protein n=1 Tax=candidate division WS6 bacterium GW2011_GWA2_37_6 TaxID=1619087 RepID=A0A0G0H1K2_9BACT|nr:MAG: hypothetical protein US52_C0010G0007 [candidate division WS6 bacterium GW2011_GWA2_37_6]KKT83935.1 MAG: hypothetical protein UW80_C0004G0018 [Microgenomates group bacterium GW2011_GWC1_44_9]